MGRAPHRTSATLALILATAAFTVCFYAWAVFGPLSPTLQRQLALGDVEVSWLVATPVVLGSLLRVPMGALTDRLGARTVFPALMLLVVLPLAGLAVWHTGFAALLGFGFVLGFAGASFAVGVPYVTRWYGAERQGLALGIYGMGMGGTVVTALTAPTIAQRWSVGACFGVAALLVAAGAVLFRVVAPEPPTPRPSASTLAASFSVFRTAPRAWALTLFYFVAFGGFVAMFLYLPKLLVGVHHLQPADAGARAAGFALLAVAGRPLGGWLADRAGASSVLALGFAGCAVAAAVLAVTYGRGVQARRAGVPPPGGRGDRRRRRRGRAGRVLPPAGHGRRPHADRQLPARVRPARGDVRVLHRGAADDGSPRGGDTNQYR